MDLILETERLILRPFEFSDAEAFFKMDNNTEVHKYLWNKPTEKIEETIKTIEIVKQQYMDNKIGRFAVVLKETNEFMGWAGLKYCKQMINNKIDFYDIGYRIDPNFWGKGYATEASFPWLEYGFKTMEIPTMTASAHTANIASNRILQKIGMKMTEQYLEDNISWNWYEMESNFK